MSYIPIEWLHKKNADKLYLELANRPEIKPKIQDTVLNNVVFDYLMKFYESRLFVNCLSYFTFVFMTLFFYMYFLDLPKVSYDEIRREFIIERWTELRSNEQGARIVILILNFIFLVLELVKTYYSLKSRITGASGTKGSWFSAFSMESNSSSVGIARQLFRAFERLVYGVLGFLMSLTLALVLNAIVLGM